MNVDERLLIRAQDLPGPLPEGSPVLYRDGEELVHGYFTRKGILALTGGDLVRRDEVYLDVSEPELNEQGWPSRVDGHMIASSQLVMAVGDLCNVQYAEGSEGQPGSWLVVRGDGKFMRLAVEIEPETEHADRMALVAALKMSKG